MNYQDYYFQKSSDVLFIDEDVKRVGVLNETPQYTLDVDGTINTSNILGINASLSNIQADLVVVDTIVAGSNLSEFVQADNAVIENVECVNIQASSNVVIGSNIALLNTFINRECPIPSQGSVMGWSLGGGWIHSSWIRVDNDFGAFVEGLLNLGQTGYDIFQAIQRVFDPDGKLGDGLKDELQDALDGGDSNDLKKIFVDWGNVKAKPLYADKTTKDVAIKGNLYLNEAQSIYSVNSSYLTLGNNLNLELISTFNADKILDVGTKHAYLNDVTTSNIIVTSNLQSTEINANEIITNTLSGNSVRVGDFYLNDNGIYRGDPNNPLASVLIIGSDGLYKSTIDKGQITDLESFSLNAISDGTLIWTGYGDVVGNELLNDPFLIQNPLFVVN